MKNWLYQDTVVTERPTEVAPRKDRLHPWAWLCALLPFVALAVWRAGQGTGVEGDDFGQYLMHARALAEGRPYSDIGYIYSNYARWIGPRMAPPGLPIVLALIQTVFGPNMIVMKLVMLAFATAFVLFAGLYFAREHGERIGLAVTLLCGLSPAIVHNASQFLTDLPSAAVIWCLILLIDRPGHFSLAKVAGVTALGAFAVLLRPTGIAVGGALFIYALVHHRAAGLRPALPLVIWVAGLLILAAVANIDHTAVVQVGPGAMYEWVWKERLPLENFKEYLSAISASHLYPFPWVPANDIFHVITAALMTVGLFGWVRRSYGQFGVILPACYFLFLLLMPLNHPRYLWPLYPVFVFGLLNGLSIVASYLVRSPARAPSVALAFALLLTPPAIVDVMAQPAPINLDDIPEVAQVFRYVERTAARESMRVTFFKPRTLAWATGVPAMGPPRGKPECLTHELRNQEITHVIIGSLGGHQNSDLRLAVERWPNLFNRQMQNGIFTVFRFNGGLLSTPKPDYCR